jgi:hypothetical protein
VNAGGLITQSKGGKAQRIQKGRGIGVENLVDGCDYRRRQERFVDHPELIEGDIEPQRALDVGLC